MKKLLSLTLALLLTASALTGCSQKTENADAPAASDQKPSAVDAVPGEAETTASDERLESGLPEADWGGATFTV